MQPLHLRHGEGAQARDTGARGGAGRAGALAGPRGARHAGAQGARNDAGCAGRGARRAGKGTLALGERALRHGAGLTTTRPRARGLCAQDELWLCTWCTWPVFYSVRLLSHFLGTVHEHCSSQIFFPKKKRFFNKIK